MLMFKRRVVQSSGGEWDALDQLDDEPKPRERIFVYRRVEHHGVAFLDWRSKGGRRQGGMSHLARYQFLDPQPCDTAPLRTTAGWRGWCEGAEAVGQTKEASRG